MSANRFRFRAWHLASESWIPERDLEFWAMRSLWRPDVQNKNVILMQSTGLLDKNGKEIFEGDIIECSNHVVTFRGDVYWDSYEWAVRDFFCSSFDDPSAAFSEMPTDKCWEILGSIHANPELLK
jgi:uncharacterized phage protein (TIGR01671 family)